MSVYRNLRFEVRCDPLNCLECSLRDFVLCRDDVTMASALMCRNDACLSSLCLRYALKIASAEREGERVYVEEREERALPPPAPRLISSPSIKAACGVRFSSNSLLINYPNRKIRQ